MPENKRLKKQAQQLIEFAFVAPILIMFLLLIIQFGMAINTRNTISEATKAALIQVNNKYNNLTNTTDAAKLTAMQNNIKSEIIDYMMQHNIPLTSTPSVVISTDANGVSTVRTTYMYPMAFNLIPGVPTIPLQSSQIINTAMLKANNFNSGFTVDQLSSFFPTSYGAMNTGGAITGYNIRNNTAILVNWYEDNDITDLGLDIFARLYSWYGEDLLPANLKINCRTATLYIRSPYYNDGDWFNTNIPYVWVVSALGYTQVYFTKFNATVDITGHTFGYTLNSCNIGNHYWAQPTAWADSCPLAWGQGETTSSWYEYLYKINPLDYDETNHNKFMNSLGYRWCGVAGQPACNANQTGSHTVQELALKGIAREGVYCTNHNVDYYYQVDGSYENVINSGGTNINYLQHYRVQSPNNNSAFDGQYVINIFQPIINYYYTSASKPADAAKLIDSNGPLYSPFRWSFDLNGSGVYNGGGGSNTTIIDVYIDSDADGIPDAWDDVPDFFDADADGQLDGLQKNTSCVEHDKGQHHKDCKKDKVNNLYYKDQVDTLNSPWNVNAVNPGNDGFHHPNTLGWTNYTFPVPGVNPVISLPMLPHIKWSITNHSKKNDGSLNSLIPTNIPSLGFFNFKLYNGMLYIPCDNDQIGATGPVPVYPYDGLCRQVETWSSNAATALAQKANFINGHVSGSAIVLDKSDELNYLDTNNFSANNKVTRTPAGW